MIAGLSRQFAGAMGEGASARLAATLAPRFAVLMIILGMHGRTREHFG